MKTMALLPASLLGAFSIFCAVLCDDPSSDVTPSGNSSDFFITSWYHEQDNYLQGNYSVLYNLPDDNPNNTVYYSFIFVGVNHNLTDFFPLEGISNNTEFYLYSQWLTKFVPSVYTVVFTVALPLNFMAILMFILKIKIKTPAVVYMLNLAAADVLFVVVLPFNIVYRFSGNNWQIGEGMCRVVIGAFYCNMYCSILLMTSMSVDRYMAVVFPIHSRIWRTKKRAWLVCVFIWLISIASTIPLLLTKQTLYIEALDITTCHDVLELKDQQNFYMYYFTVFSSVFFFFPLIITIFCYFGIIKTLSNSSVDADNSSKKTRAIIMTIIVLCVFIVCFGPTNIIFLMHYLHFLNGHAESLYFAYLLCACISSISSCLDPLMYYYASSRCRKYLYSLLCCTTPNKLQTTRGPTVSRTESSFIK
ncbi:proteinase-activated receptor 1-like [Engystomops pustulosus]|uniref:proteinase-activated receptor 1-like n=1 Tax=Engystomops pustulosus TaxID=76066 RepID=UPI003AFA71AC